jgi:hypothetical protein
VDGGVTVDVGVGMGDSNALGSVSGRSRLMNVNLKMRNIKPTISAAVIKTHDRRWNCGVLVIVFGDLAVGIVDVPFGK